MATTLPAPRGSRRAHKTSSRPEVTFTTAGTFRAHPRGFGFVTLAAPYTHGATVIDSAFLPPNLAAQFFTDDHLTVTVEVAAGRGTVTTAVLKSRTRTTVFGQFTTKNGVAVLDVDPQVSSMTLPVREADVRGTYGHVTLPGDLTENVTVIEAWSTMCPAALRQMMFARHQLPLGRAADVHEAARQAAADARARLRAPVTGPRRDLTNTTTFTIDSASTRDLDDAVSAHALADGGWRVQVHIADVAGAIGPGSVLDQDAYEVGTSVYLPGWNRPMLPAELSEDVLSLLPGQVRDTLTVSYVVNADGTTTDHDVALSRVTSDARLTYEGSSQALTSGVRGDMPRRVFNALKDAAAAADALGAERGTRTPLGERARTEATWSVGVEPGHGDDAYTDATFTRSHTATPYATEQLIERLMVAANEAVATWLAQRNLPGVFRTHAAPGEELTADLTALIDAMPANSRPTDVAGPTPAHMLAAFADQIATRDTDMVDALLMRHLSRATYVAEAGEHFGLGSTGYLHFTSPIRRYSDLLVHRVIHAHLAGDTATVETLRTFIEDAAEHLTAASGVAARIEGQFRRYATEVLYADEVGDRPQQGVITGFNARGAFVAVPEHGVSGMVTYKALSGFWEPDAQFVSATDDRSGNTLLLGDRFRCQVSHLDPWTGTVDMVRVKRSTRRRRTRR